MSQTWYVGGTVRSGSTLLSGLLAEATRGVNVGELHILWRSVGLQRTCTCGRPLQSCGVWGPVLERVLDRMGLASAAVAAKIEAEEPSQRRVTVRGRGASIPESVVNLRRETEGAIREVTGSSVIVDSSKVAGTLLVAARSGTDVRAVHLVRDPRAVAYSMANPKSDPSLAGRPLPAAGPGRSSLMWLSTNLAFERLAAGSAVPLTRLRYEDFMQSPVESVNELLGGDGQLVSDALSSSGEHAVAGNPWRFEPSRPLERDRRWEEKLGRCDSLTVTLATLPGLLRYRYSVTPGA